MRTLAALACCAWAQATAGEAPTRGLWETFKRDHGRRYADAAEEATRFGVFVDNLHAAAAQGRAEPAGGAEFGVTAFADRTEAEFRAYRGAVPPIPSGMPREKVQNPHGAADDIDWRQYGAVSAVQDQGACASGWAFAAAGNAESQAVLFMGRTLTPLSVQQVVSCDTTGRGCGGGAAASAWQWLLDTQQGQWVPDAAYPYASGNGSAPACRMSATPEGVAITGWRAYESSIKAVQDAVTRYGPVAVAVDASGWKAYSSGVFKGGCASAECTLDHVALLVGYGAAPDGTFYWTLKNSWGTSFGEAGYIRVAFGRCGVERQPASAYVV